MKKFVVMKLAALCAASLVICSCRTVIMVPTASQTYPPVTISAPKDQTKPHAPQQDERSRRCHHQDRTGQGCACPSGECGADICCCTSGCSCKSGHSHGVSGGPTKTLFYVTRNSLAEPTHVWSEPTAPVVSPAVTVRPAPVYVPPALHTPRKSYISIPFFASASASVGTYGSGYYPQTYWQYDSAGQEHHNIATTRAMYRGGYSGYGQYDYGQRLTGENYNSGIRSFPSPVNINRRR